MSKISRAIREIQTMEELAQRDQWVNRIHPLVKLFLTVFYIAVVVSFPKYQLTGLLGMMIYPLFLFEMGELSVREALHRLRIVLPLVCVAGIFNPFFDREILICWGSFAISGGVISMVTLMLKGIFTVLATYLLIASTSIESICYAMRLIHIPKVFVTQILLIYRYITVLLKETDRMMQAYALRAPGQKGVHVKAWGSMMGQLLLRSMDRAEELYESMCLRGYHGEFYCGKSVGFLGKDLAFLLIWTAVILIFRLFPVLEYVGSMFV